MNGNTGIKLIQSSDEVMTSKNDIDVLFDDIHFTLIIAIRNLRGSNRDYIKAEKYIWRATENLEKLKKSIRSGN